MVLGFRILPVARDPRRGEEQDFVLGKVSISGAWHGAVTLGCSTGLARRAAAAMFGKLPADRDLPLPRTGEVVLGLTESLQCVSVGTMTTASAKGRSTTRSR